MNEDSDKMKMKRERKNWEMTDRNKNWWEAGEAGEKMKERKKIKKSNEE